MEKESESSKGEKISSVTALSASCNDGHEQKSIPSRFDAPESGSVSLLGALFDTSDHQQVIELQEQVWCPLERKINKTNDIEVKTHFCTSLDSSGGNDSNKKDVADTDLRFAHNGESQHVSFGSESMLDKASSDSVSEKARSQILARVPIDRELMQQLLEENMRLKEEIAQTKEIGELRLAEAKNEKGRLMEEMEALRQELEQYQNSCDDFMEV